ncbi:helix-turn-helix domain-containing protein [Niallia sp. FSL W8-0635]|uniref:helix-turn-helix domain-containing protein n=1 Tax=Niallia sp. FSL W8-0635 TaxID=2975337 RepID=UPI002B03F8FF|nr:transposase [Yersinia enterocolitica]
MSKYNEKFKFMIVKEYQEGKLGYKLLAKKHDIKSHKQIINWVKNYEKFGMEGLTRKKQNKTYSVQFKLNVLSFMKRTGFSVTETALEFGLTNPPMITAWKKAFLEEGAESLEKPKGRPPMSDKAKNKNKKTIEDADESYEQKLERENELLRLEVAYLKKLRAFQMNPEDYLEKHKQRYHSNLKKSSD